MSTDYELLARREADHWGRKGVEVDNPQSWEDPFLHELFFGAEERRFLDAITAAGPRALELGCGYGEHAMALAARGLRITAIDISAERIRRAEQRLQRHPPRFIVGNLDTMELPGGPYDVVYAHDALHHCLRIERVIAEAHRVLRPGGRLIVSDYRGTWRWLRLLSVASVGVLPTVMPYREKWARRRRVHAWVASEREKRAALARGSGDALHESSPFEGISQESIAPAIARRFEILEHRTRLPFWWYLAPKLRLGRMRQRALRAMRRWDDRLLALGVPGAYFTIVARRPMSPEPAHPAAPPDPTQVGWDAGR